MAGNAQSDNSNAQPNNGYQDTRSDYRVIKDAGYDNMKHLMQCYNINPYDPRDPDAHAEAKAIVQAFRDSDAYNATGSEQHANGSGASGSSGQATSGNGGGKSQ